jgi:hypothetical protein
LLHNLAKETSGAALPRLHVLAAEGAEAGERVVERTGGLDARVLEAENLPEVVDRFGIQAVPFLIYTDFHGRVERTRVGALSPRERGELIERTRAAAGVPE